MTQAEAERTARKRRASHLRALLLVLLAGPLTVGFATGHLPLACPSQREMPVRGIDVSHHQGAIDWAAVAAGGIDFAYLKATEGGDWVDPRFEQSWRDAGAQRGLYRGAYHFFTLCRSGEAQARNFVETVPREEGALPPAVDFELGGNCAARPPRAEILADLDTFLVALERRYGLRPVLYATREAYDAYLGGSYDDRPFWSRDLLRRPSYPEGGRWVIWQFHNRGRVRGVRGPVDLNAFSGTEADFDAWRRTGLLP